MLRPPPKSQPTRPNPLTWMVSSLDLLHYQAHPNRPALVLSAPISLLPTHNKSSLRAPHTLATSHQSPYGQLPQPLATHQSNPHFSHRRVPYATHFSSKGPKKLRSEAGNHTEDPFWKIREHSTLWYSTLEKPTPSPTELPALQHPALKLNTT